MPIPKLKKSALKVPKAVAGSPSQDSGGGLGAFDIVFAGLFFLGAAFLFMKGRKNESSNVIQGNFGAGKP